MHIGAYSKEVRSSYVGSRLRFCRQSAISQLILKVIIWEQEVQFHTEGHDLPMERSRLMILSKALHTSSDKFEFDDYHPVLHS